MSGITNIFNRFSKHARDKQESTHGLLNCEILVMVIGTPEGILIWRSDGDLEGVGFLTVRGDVVGEPGGRVGQKVGHALEVSVCEVHMM